MRNIRMILYGLIACSITTCFVISVYTYIKKPLKYGYHKYSNEKSNTNSADTDYVEMTITSMKNGQFYGNIQYIARAQKSINYINNKYKIYLRYYDPTGNPQYGEVVSLHQNNKIEDKPTYQTDSDIILYKQFFYSKNFPLDYYVLPFGPNVVFYNGTDKHEETIPSGKITLNLPPNYRISDISSKVTELTDYGKTDQKGGLYLEVKPHAWFKALFVGILVFLTIPVMLTVVADIKMVGLDVITFIVTLVTTRTVLVDNTFNIYNVDAYFIGMSFLLCLIVLYKLYRSERIPNNL